MVGHPLVDPQLRLREDDRALFGALDHVQLVDRAFVHLLAPGRNGNQDPVLGRAHVPVRVDEVGGGRLHPHRPEVSHVHDPVAGQAHEPDLHRARDHVHERAEDHIRPRARDRGHAPPAPRGRPRVPVRGDGVDVDQGPVREHLRDNGVGRVRDRLDVHGPGRDHTREHGQVRIRERDDVPEGVDEDVRLHAVDLGRERAREAVHARDVDHDVVRGPDRAQEVNLDLLHHLVHGPDRVDGQGQDHGHVRRRGGTHELELARVRHRLRVAVGPRDREDLERSEVDRAPDLVHGRPVLRVRDSAREPVLVRDCERVAGRDLVHDQGHLHDRLPVRPLPRLRDHIRLHARPPAAARLLDPARLRNPEHARRQLLVHPRGQEQGQPHLHLPGRLRADGVDDDRVQVRGRHRVHVAVHGPVRGRERSGVLVHDLVQDHVRGPALAQERLRGLVQAQPHVREDGPLHGLAPAAGRAHVVGRARVRAHDRALCVLQLATGVG